MLLPAASTLESLGSFYLFIFFKNLLLFFKFYFIFKLYNIVLVLPFRELLKIENPMDGGAWKVAVHGVAGGWI